MVLAFKGKQSTLTVKRRASVDKYTSGYAPNPENQMRSIVAALMILVSPSAFAQSEWIQYGEGGGAKFYVRAGSIHTVGQYKRMWTLQNFLEPDKEGDRSSIILSEYNCNTRQYRYLQMTFYKGQMGQGAAGTTLTRPNDWRYVTPGTVGESGLEIACSN